MIGKALVVLILAAVGIYFSRLDDWEFTTFIFLAAALFGGVGLLEGK
jgi:hypothetical protein